MLNKVKDFIEGNIKYYKNKLFDSPEYIQEQVYYRLYICKDDCVEIGTCQGCGTCPTQKKVLLNTSCNQGKRFPDLMGYDAWQAFKKEKNIDIEKIMKDG